ncbi:hypothetical protein IEQ34_006988 [Dendrobium chrysotoxum]|uniref:Cation/H+ exchanger domain-containing protein n=1 Tax=Dendrobium chrysotoxum TaxID=161865 RepID=A0AAV7H5J9_DENCH|nr:hypothetical protein IEQ34_006988 [Dendrobium chrysotoxum]
MSRNNTPATASATAIADNYTISIGRTHCSLISSSIGASFSIFFFNIVVILISCKIVHVFLRRLGQHQMISDFIIGLIVGNVNIVRSSMEEHVVHSIAHISSIAFAFYLFVVALEMDPKRILRCSGPHTRIALIGIISTIGVTLFSYTLINRAALSLPINPSHPIISAISISLAATSSPILTRLVTELKIHKSEIGRLAVRTALANDLLCTSLMCLGVAVYTFHSPYSRISSAAISATLRILVIAVEAWLIPKLINPVLRKINDRNPEGKPIRGLDMAAVCGVSAILCYCSTFIGFDPSFNAFVVGLCLPRDGRMSNFLIGRINFMLSTIMLPLCLVLVGISCDLGSLIRAEERSNVYKMMIVGLIGAVGKITGTVVYSIRHGMKWQEAVALALLLNIKGYFHIFCAHNAAMAGVIDNNIMMVMILIAIGTVIPTPLVVAFIVRRARARERGKPMGLQWSKPGGEIRILVGLHGPEDVPMAVNMIEAMRGEGDVGGGLAAFVVDMVEMTDKAAASLVHGEGMEAVTVKDEGIVEMREQIGSALEAYVGESGEGLTVRRMLAVSSFDNMHEDICSAAQDCLAVLIILPFHRRQLLDGTMEAGHPGHRLLNQKVLQLSPCSVAILVNRGLHRSISSSLSTAAQNTCAVFIGGADDREALAFASLISHHPAVKLTVLRFLTEARNKPSGPGRRVLTAAGKQEIEHKTDDEFFMGFYERYVAGGKGVGYMEKNVESGAETVATLRALEGRYQLFIVGRGKDRISVLTAGMSEWAECPELGPIGDILAASDFSVSASIMVVQQRDVAQGFNVIDDEFLPL